MVLKSLGVAGDSDTGVTLVESLDELVTEIVDDLYLRHFGHERDDPLLGYADALELAREVVKHPATELRPEGADPDSRAAMCVNFAKDVLAELEIRKRQRGILGYDDLLTRLNDALDADDSPAQLRMHQRWPIVMVDEFQDTDPVQWKVIDRAFTDRSTLILIGDPKQAIYAFRGGDIVTYLNAAQTAGVQKTLATNWRSDGDLVQRLQVILRGAALGRSADHRAPRRRAPRRFTPVGSAVRRPVPAAGRAPGELRPQRNQSDPDRRSALAHPRRYGRRHRQPAGERRHVRRRAGRCGSRRGDRREAQGRPCLFRRAVRSRHPRGVHR